MLEGGLAGLLIGSKNEIFARFVSATQSEVAAAKTASRPLIIDTLPAFITALGLALSPHNARRMATDGSTVAMTHGQERAELTGYTLDNLLHEYQLLRKIIFDVLLAHGGMDTASVAVINESIDRAIREATAAFVSVLDELRSRVAATLTHDLRGPLGAAFNYVELIGRAGESAEMRERFCAGAMRNLGRVRQMIDDLLDRSRARAGEPLQLRFESLELRELVEEVLTDARTAHGERYVLNAPRPVPGVWCAEALKRAVFNLVENATKYGDEASPIVVSLTELQGNVQIAVHNLGPTISREDQVTLFDPFRRGQSEPTNASRGWGLGLTAVKEIAEAHGGTVMVESSDAEGTTFVLQVFQDATQFVPKTRR